VGVGKGGIDGFISNDIQNADYDDDRFERNQRD
jgi:hypothetical protein